MRRIPDHLLMVFEKVRSIIAKVLVVWKTWKVMYLLKNLFRFLHWKSCAQLLSNMKFENIFTLVNATSEYLEHESLLVKRWNTVSQSFYSWTFTSSSKLNFLKLLLNYLLVYNSYSCEIYIKVILKYCYILILKCFAITELFAYGIRFTALVIPCRFSRFLDNRYQFWAKDHPHCLKSTKKFWWCNEL